MKHFREQVACMAMAMAPSSPHCLPVPAAWPSSRQAGHDLDVGDLGRRHRPCEWAQRGCSTREPGRMTGRSTPGKSTPGRKRDARNWLRWTAGHGHAITATRAAISPAASRPAFLPLLPRPSPEPADGTTRSSGNDGAGGAAHRFHHPFSLLFLQRIKESVCS